MKKIIITSISLLTSLSFCVQSHAQSGAYNPIKRPNDWWQADWKKDSLPGISLDEAYAYLKGRKSKQVIVAIIDNCVDTANEELKDFIWTNKKEIPGNGIDDDHNGYVDDIHGWCFVANKNNIIQARQSSTEALIYEAWKAQFEHVDTTKLTASTKIQYDMYQTSKKVLFDRYHFCQLATLLRADSLRYMKYMDHLLADYIDRKLSEIPFSTLLFSNSYDSTANTFYTLFQKIIKPVNTLRRFNNWLKSDPGNFNNYFNYVVFNDKYKYDTTNNYRAIVGDDPNDFNDKDYGSPSVNLPGIAGPHATLIAGIIAANRNNNIGIKGIADNVLIMPLITWVPDGGSISKDIVMAVHYAVDNGASIINMSFGMLPWIDEHEKEMRESFDYAYTHNVLIVNAAGNDGADLDNEKYLLGEGSDGKEHDNYIRVGATTTLFNDSLVWVLSQFGEKTVDLFAPGAAIYSTTPGNKYESNSGTSLACPVVVGVAALLKSYFPSLTAKKIKEILMKSVDKPDIMVMPPSRSGFTNKIPFSKMSKSGGIVNAFNAVKLADEMTKKSK